MKLLRRYTVKLVRILLGLAIMALGIAIAKQAYCLSPWQVLNDGLAHTFSISIGTANIYVGIVILLLDMLIREKFGIGMVLNIVMTGVFTDMYLSLNTTFGIMPKAEAIPLQILFCLAAVLLNALGMYFYMSAWMGAGPRDTLVVFFGKASTRSVGAVQAWSGSNCVYSRLAYRRRNRGWFCAVCFAGRPYASMGVSVVPFQC